MKKLTYKQKNHLLSKSKKSQRKRKRGRTFRKKRAFSHSHNTRGRYRESYLEKKRKEIEKKDYYVTPPKNLCIRTNTIELINFINELKGHLRGRQFISRMNFDLENIENIEIGAISMFLSVVEEYSTLGVNCRGSMPKNERCRRIIELSGFLSHMSTISGSKVANIEGRNTILKRGKDTLNSKKTGKLIKAAIKKITGVESHYKPLFSMVNEININSLEHAYKDNENTHWFFSIYHDIAESKVVFVFADNGLGIVNRLNRTYGRKLFEKLNLKTDGEILKDAFDKKYGSRYSHQPNRNKGLPSIRKIQDNNYINNLIVITNGVYLNLNDGEEIKLSADYSGTFYYWELDEKCVNLYYDDRKVAV